MSSHVTSPGSPSPTLLFNAARDSASIYRARRVFSNFQTENFSNFRQFQKLSREFEARFWHRTFESCHKFTQERS